MQEIIKYLKEIYQPLSLIVYGSYADGTNDEDSDFDCLIVSNVRGVRHDTSIVDGVRLDAFIYAPEDLDDLNPYEIVQIENGSVIMDTHGIAILLKEKVRSYLHNLPEKSRNELLDSLVWYEQMVRRIAREDAESYFRWHWLLCDSLEIYCHLIGIRYLGPKKSLTDMQRRNPDAYVLYLNALQGFTKRSLHEWIGYLRKIANERL